MLKKAFLWYYLFICLCSCSKNIELDNGFVKYLYNNKKNIYIYLVNDEATIEINKIYQKYNENIYDTNGLLKDNYIVPNDNKLLGWYNIKNNFEENFFQYIILNGNEIPIGKHISKIKTRKGEKDIFITCYLDTDGNKIFNDFTSNNINRNLAVVLDDKVIVVAMILEPIKGTINFAIKY
jgi:preprotein translocase subunit SecD